jgi:cob(I)alamin adenosyltransferase
MQTCRQCRTEKPEDQFSPDARTITGYASICRDCAEQKAIDNFLKRRGKPRQGFDTERARRANLTWREANPDRYRAYQRQYHKEWLARNRERVAAQRRARRATRKLEEDFARLKTKRSCGATATS